MARLLSYLLHPLLMPTFTLWLALRIDPHLAYFITPEDRWKVLMMVALMTIAFPLTSALLLMRAGLVSNLEMPRRQERIGPYAMSLMYYGMTAYLLARTPLHPMAFSLFIGAAIALLFTTLITLRWKISAHMVGIGGCLGAIVALGQAHALNAFAPIAAIAVVAGALGTARLLASDHSPAQVYAGTALGFVSVLTAMLLTPALRF
ncbi:MAG: hypothetical protein IPJ85_12595 [Flavobacteriales bacterium]|nr:hypothetical protein [Flavobacteriales bacterium]